MAAASPEGEAWFFHEALTVKDKFDPADPKQFYSHVLLEVVTNYTVDEGYYVPKIPWEDHPRAQKQEWNPAARTSYARYKFMTVMTGPSCGKITRQQAVHGSFDYWELKPQSGKQMVALVPVLIPNIDERFLYVDLTYPLRGIYFPKSHLAHPKYSNMCTYSRLDFRSRKVTLKAYTPDYSKMVKEVMKKTGSQLGSIAGQPGSQAGGAMGSLFGGLAESSYGLYPHKESKQEPGILEQEKERQKKESSLWFFQEDECLPNDATTGWGFQPQWTARFDIFSLTRVLAIPDHLLKPDYRDPYQFIKLFSCKALAGAKPEKADSTMNSTDVVRFDQLVSKQLGIQFDYKGNGLDPNWLVKVLSGIAAVALSCIPMIGPLVALGEQLIVDAILDPESFKSQQGLISKIPGVVGAMTATGQNTKAFLSETASKARPSTVLAVESPERQSVYVGPEDTDASKQKGQEDKGRPDSESRNFENAADGPCIIEQPWTEKDLSNLEDAPSPKNALVYVGE
ncbi:uncharacterized protein Aud_000121 [Aspergillus udagawae]|uniref:Uncharacterized protein n=1 Tax=Aspergillus udagawae TaxID=91492 RepID=A0A8E0QJQ2_9EURO|nr:uncharacterized protein Aud_000121 [Aspergillus udagawae]GIC84306.1 hypothetical protein Aud_000121 [Aspergillus udagawae]